MTETIKSPGDDLSFQHSHLSLHPIHVGQFSILSVMLRFDHLVAIERSGRASDGNYYNMRGVNIKHLVDPIDDLFTTASTIPGISTTGWYRYYGVWYSGRLLKGPPAMHTDL